jgi:arylsulfatase A-like enzyme
VYEGTAGLIDVMPTLLDLLDVDPPPGLQGTSLAAALVKPHEPGLDRQIFSETLADRFSLESISQGRKKLIRHTYGPQQGAEELYDLIQDPQERTNLAAQAGAQAAELQQELDVFNKLTRQVAQNVEAQQVELDKDTEKVLRSLGYIK